MNLNGGGVVTSPSPVSQLLASPTTPKLCNLPSSLIPPLTPTPIKTAIEKNNKNESVTVTHFSDLHGGVVEKISVPVTSSSSSSGGFMENGSAVRSTANNPFTDELLTTTIITTSTTTSSPSIKISTNPFLRNSFNAHERIDNITDKSLKISFAIGVNPFNISDASDDMNGNDNNKNTNGDVSKSSNEDNLFNISNDHDEVDDVDNENNRSLIINKNNNNNEVNVTKIQMDDVQTNGGIKKVCHSY